MCTGMDQPERKMTTDDFYLHPPFTEQELKEEAESEELQIRFIKLVNCENIICGVVDEMETDDIMYVCFPMRLEELFDEIEGTVEYLFIPWIPFSADETAIPISKCSIITCTQVTELMETTYLNKLVELDDDMVEEEVAPAITKERIPPVHPWVWATKGDASSDEACTSPTKT